MYRLAFTGGLKMEMSKEQILNGYRKKCELLKSLGGREKRITEDRTIKWKSVEFDLKNGWVVPDTSDENLAKMMHMDNIIFKRWASKTDITFSEIEKIIAEVFSK